MRCVVYNAFGVPAEIFYVADRPVPARNKPYDMGTLFLDGEQTPAFRRFRTLLLNIVGDLGGYDALSTAEVNSRAVDR